MSDAKEVEFSLKVFVNKEKTKVLFAEAEHDFADVLLSFLWLPLGKIVKILEKHYGENAPTIGSLNTLYNGLTNPENVTLWTQYGKYALNNPESAFQNSRLKISVDYINPSRYKFGESYHGCFTPNSASFIISDDLRMLPNMSGSIMQTLAKLGIDMADMNMAEMRNVTLGLKEVIDLLSGALLSCCPLSDLIFDKRQTTNTTIVSEAGISMHDQLEIDANYKSMKMILKVMFQKFTKKLLFAQADEDFVDFLFSLLIIPLGRVEWLLGSNTCLNNIDNLHRSIADHIDHKYLTVRKEEVMKPEVHNMYYFRHFIPFCDPRKLSHNSLQKPEKPLFVGGSRIYMVTDDLTVNRLCISSTVSLLNQMKISLSDVKEVELHIGLEEGQQKYISYSAKRMSGAKEVEFSLKVFVNKEKTKVLFAEAEHDFADVLLSFMWLPLGSIMQTLAKLGIDMADMNMAEMRNMTLGLKEVIDLLSGALLSCSPLSDLIFEKSLLIIPLGRVEWLLGSNTCLNNIDNLHRSIADHIDHKYLTVRKEEMKISLSDVEEVELHIGLEEVGFFVISSITP
ncbi:hypothetical protein ACS0TY_030240 [Phlomoides rotata]